MNCRHCGQRIDRVFIDLGHQPHSNAYLDHEQLLRPETHYPLCAYVCEHCWLVQVPEHVAADRLFTTDYAYFSSISASWVEHARLYVEAIVQRLGLGADSFVVEVASNDGYLLQFVRQRGIPCLGIEPTASTAGAARRRGIETREVFLGVESARQLVAQRGRADLLIGNNVLAHVPEINDFVGGIRELLADEGVATLEFPHLMRLVEGKQFDTIYHEHYSYLSLHAVRSVFEHQGLRLFDVEQLPTHGGSLRIFAARAESSTHATSERLDALLVLEEQTGMLEPSYYAHLQLAAERIKDDLLGFLLEQKRAGKSVAGYGAAAKGNTLLNFAGVRRDLLPFVCDAAPAKQGRYLPGSHIPILAPSAIDEARPDFVLILPWNISDEIVTSLSRVLDWGGRFVTAIPELKLL